VRGAVDYGAGADRRRAPAAAIERSKSGLGSERMVEILAKISQFAKTALCASPKSK
jgi:hypothetical protein